VMRELPDVNVLVAVAWPNHVHHAPARAWLGQALVDGWATTPVTESGFIRVSANARVHDQAVSPKAAAGMLRRLRALDGHAFLADDVSLATTELVDLQAVQGHRQVTDVHILAVARLHGARVVTFDGGLATMGGDDVKRLHL